MKSLFYYLSRYLLTISHVCFIFFLTFLSGCSTPVVKIDAIDNKVLANEPVPAQYIENAENGELKVIPDTGWMEGIDSSRYLSFVGYRQVDNTLTFCLVVECNPSQDRLVLFPLENPYTPVSALRDSETREKLHKIVDDYNQEGKGTGLIKISLSRAIQEKKLGPPLPEPHRILAVAANFPSHIKYDLAINNKKKLEILSKPLARVFQKYPPVPPPGESETASFKVIGPYDGISYPSHVTVPARKIGLPREKVKTMLDYEVEIGIVIGQTLTADIVNNALDSELRSAISGYVLVSDTKARNPQVVLKVASEDKIYTKNPYHSTEDVDRPFGFWNPLTYQWWSYAASWGNYASIGPVFAAAPDDLSFPPRAMISARSYGPVTQRNYPIPKKLTENTLYLRQGSVTTEEESYGDALIWKIPDIVRSIFSPESVITSAEESFQLEPGDIICLGTPGGTVITSKPYWFFNFFEALLFWKDPLDWHNTFFKNTEKLYLHDSDKVFFWAEGLGFQYQPIRKIQVPLSTH